MRLPIGKDKIQKILIAALLLGFSLFLCMQSRLSPFSHEVSGTDSSVFRYVAYLMGKGYVPYRDTFDHKGPLIYFIDYFGMLLDWEWGIWIFEVLALYVGVLFSYKTIRMFADRLIAFLAVMSAYSILGDCFKGGNMTEEFAIPFLAAGLYFFTGYLYDRRLKRKEIFFSGVCFAAVCLLRVNMIAIWLVCIPLILLLHIYQKQWPEIRKCAVYFLAGTMSAMLLPLVYLLWNHALRDCFRVYILFNLSYSGYQSLRSRLDCYQYFIAQPFVYLTVFALFYLWYVYAKKKLDIKMDGWLLAALTGCFILTFPLMCMSGRQDINYEMVLIPTLVAPIGCLYRFILRKEKGEAVSAVSCFAVFWIINAIVTPCMLKVWNHTLEQSMGTEKNVWLEKVKTVSESYCSETDTISVFGNKDIIYLLCDKRSASKYSYQFPIIEARRGIYQEYLEDIRKNTPKMVVIDQGFAKEYEGIFKAWLLENSYAAADQQETIFIRQ